MTTQRGSGRHRAEDDGGFAVLLREGRGHEQCYDAFSPALYRYCWSLLGPGPGEEDAPGAAVYATFLAAVELLPRLRDRNAVRPWLFALARTACQHRGFARSTPYGALPTSAEERPVVNAVLQMPPSQRELLELSMRHGLSHTQIATVLGLDPETTGELCRSAAKRAVDLLSDEVEPDGAMPFRPVPADLPGLLSSVALPGPPRSLRERVVSDCADPDAAPKRQAAGTLVRPLGPNGFPLHRTRGPVPSAPQGPEEAPLFDATEEDADPARVPADRVTTFDLPLPHYTEPLSELAPAVGGAAPDERDQRSRWLLPATAGLATALVAFGLWGAGALLRDVPETTVAEGPPPGQVNATPLSGDAAGTPEPDRDHGPAAAGTAPTASAPGTPPPTGERSATADPTSGPHHPDTPPSPGPHPGPESRPSPEASPSTAAPSPDPVSEKPDDAVTTLLDGVRDLLGLDRDQR
ncbi:RNA polymerase sigma factor [Actinorugispora endophytica]|uniref:DNA-directed RNA polymerase specialized sigma24 family protein n=1 Tax=Actinorugispora endophytica TaxID=1605990 RepID=A0A4R6V0N4_9ACTN|nr:sigma-70 family RNA polymerase sigma factor [Actinorugispora endophytica]TDQ53585.1 DNA-directed RNA polymerase specialized sigma24 family protein [Actinorugispora endophytica]